MHSLTSQIPPGKKITKPISVTRHVSTHTGASSRRNNNQKQMRERHNQQRSTLTHTHFQPCKVVLFSCVRWNRVRVSLTIQTWTNPEPQKRSCERHVTRDGTCCKKERKYRLLRNKKTAQQEKKAIHQNIMIMKHFSKLSCLVFYLFLYSFYLVLSLWIFYNFINKKCIYFY